MTDDAGQSSAARFARKLGAVTAAAAALLADNAAHSRESDMLRGLLDRAAVFSPAPVVGERASLLPPPLILRSSDRVDTLMAGHRSHSSHSSHRSHVSSSIGGGRSPSSAPLDIDVGSRPRPTALPASKTTTPKLSGPALRQQTPETPVRKYEPPTNVNLENPDERFQLISVPHKKDGDAKAFIKDLETGKSVLLDIGEKIGEYTLVEVDVNQQTARLRIAGSKDVSLKKLKPKL